MSDARAVPFYCPFCGEEELFPYDEGHGTWHCGSCTRVFGLRLVGLHSRSNPSVVSATQGPAE